VRRARRGCRRVDAVCEPLVDAREVKSYLRSSAVRFPREVSAPQARAVRRGTPRRGGRPELDSRSPADRVIKPASQIVAPSTTVSLVGTQPPNRRARSLRIADPAHGGSVGVITNAEPQTPRSRRLPRIYSFLLTATDTIACRHATRHCPGKFGAGVDPVEAESVTDGLPSPSPWGHGRRRRHTDLPRDLLAGGRDAECARHVRLPIATRRAATVRQVKGELIPPRAAQFARPHEYERSICSARRTTSEPPYPRMAAAARPPASLVMLAKLLCFTDGNATLERRTGSCRPGACDGVAEDAPQALLNPMRRLDPALRLDPLQHVEYLRTGEAAHLLSTDAREHVALKPTMTRSA